ncbi:hypothetical protein MKW94_012521 [Papaver nudicaule]|uniref:O-acyltransferase WSD1 C-terminal domain-containing protein n=1 Tax=Papaver nudicaule TaxID=74823 RepID=A0AA41VSS5_PAPNU|nr:hypothetical protein [Papaver nudicaule]
MLDKKKLSFEAYFSYAITSLATFMISNVVGPQEEIMLGGNPITALSVSSSSLPHVSIVISHRLALVCSCWTIVG